jgi:hypothetical protein
VFGDEIGGAIHALSLKTQAPPGPGGDGEPPMITGSESPEQRGATAANTQPAAPAAT